MEIKELIEMMTSDRSVKLFIVDRANKNLLTGLVSNHYHARDTDEKLVNYIDLQPFIGLVDLDKIPTIKGYISDDGNGRNIDDKKYNAYQFKGWYATVDFNYHKIQAMDFVDLIRKSGHVDEKVLEEYFKLAKRL